MTQQPDWKLESNLGDVNPIEYGGYFIYSDQTGVYAPEGEKLISPDDDTNPWFVYRFIIEPCTFINGVLSDNKFHPEHPAWFASDLSSMASTFGMEANKLVEMFTSDKLMERARAWEMVGDHFGFDNLDSYPLVLNRKEVDARYKLLPSDWPHVADRNY